MGPWSCPSSHPTAGPAAPLPLLLGVLQARGGIWGGGGAAGQGWGRHALLGAVGQQVLEPPALWGLPSAGPASPALRPRSPGSSPGCGGDRACLPAPRRGCVGLLPHADILYVQNKVFWKYLVPLALPAPQWGGHDSEADGSWGSSLPVDPCHDHSSTFTGVPGAKPHWVVVGPTVQGLRGGGGGAGRCPAPGEVGAEPAWVLLMCSWRPQGALWGSGTPRLHWDAHALVGPSGHSGIPRPQQRQAAPGRAGMGTVPGAPWHCRTPAWHSLLPLLVRRDGVRLVCTGSGDRVRLVHTGTGSGGVCAHPTRGVLHPQDVHPTGSSTLTPPSGVPSCPRH